MSAYARGKAKPVAEGILAGILLLLATPLLLLCAAAVLCLDGAPVFYADTRVGLHGKVFRLWKFRSMRLAPGLPVTAATDPRITALGGRLRRWKLDELPQLWNVVRGDMSLVGPRPETPQFVDAKSREWRELLQVRPGITGAASVESFDEEARLGRATDPLEFYRAEVLPAKLALERAWLRSCSPAGDLRLILRTVARVFGSRGA